MGETKWIYKHKGVGMLSATASLGLILLWDVEGGLTQIDKLLYSNEDYIKVGVVIWIDGCGYLMYYVCSLVLCWLVGLSMLE